MWGNRQDEVKAGMADGDAVLLRELAKRLAEIGADPVQKEKVDRWTRHNDLENVGPLVLAYPEGAWRELMPVETVLQCKAPFARMLEHDLRYKLYSWDHLRDDNPIEPTFWVPMRGCVTEIIMQDTHTVRNEPRRMWEWVRIAKEVAAEYAAA